MGSDGPSHVTHEDRTVHARRVQTANVCTSHAPSSGGLWRLDMHNLTTSLGLGGTTALLEMLGRDKSSVVKCTDLRRFAALDAGTRTRQHTYPSASGPRFFSRRQSAWLNISSASENVRQRPLTCGASAKKKE